MSESKSDHEITGLLQRWKGGDDEALNLLMEIVYQELRARAKKYENSARPTLSCSVLVHECFLRLVKKRHITFQDRNHFFAVASIIIRSFVLEYCKARARLKRGGDKMIITFATDMGYEPELETMVMLNRCLEKLEKEDKKATWVFQMYHMLGMKREEIVDALNLSLATVGRNLKYSRACVLACMKGERK